MLSIKTPLYSLLDCEWLLCLNVRFWLHMLNGGMDIKEIKCFNSVTKVMIKI